MSRKRVAVSVKSPTMDTNKGLGFTARYSEKSGADSSSTIKHHLVASQYQLHAHVQVQPRAARQRETIRPALTLSRPRPAPYEESEICVRAINGEKGKGAVLKQRWVQAGAV